MSAFLVAFELDAQPVVVEGGEDGLEYGEEQRVAHLTLVAGLVVVELEAPELLVAPRRIVAQGVLRRYLEQQLGLGLFLGLRQFFAVGRFVGTLFSGGFHMA